MIQQTSLKSHKPGTNIRESQNSRVLSVLLDFAAVGEPVTAEAIGLITNIRKSTVHARLNDLFRGYAQNAVTYYAAFHSETTPTVTRLTLIRSRRYARKLTARKILNGCAKKQLPRLLNTEPPVKWRLKRCLTNEQNHNTRHLPTRRHNNRRNRAKPAVDRVRRLRPAYLIFGMPYNFGAN